MDPIEQLAAERLRELAESLVKQLDRSAATRPVLWLLARQRMRAAKAITMMLDVDPEDTRKVRELQSEMKLYDDLIKSCRVLLSRGKEAAYEVAEDERSALDEIIAEMSEDQRRLYGLQQRGN